MSNRFEVVGELATGGFARVLSVKDKDGKLYALKKPFHSADHLQYSTGIVNMKELYIMTNIKHPYIQDALTVFFDDPCPQEISILNSLPPGMGGYDRVFFLMTQARFTCHELVHQHKTDISHIKRAMFQMTCALYHLHSKGICHRDIKPGNFLCHYNNGVLLTRLTDFGMTKPMNKVNRNSLHAGTAYYRSPELLMRNGEYDFSMDVWALGCSFFEMVTKRILFKGDNDLQILNLMFLHRGSPTETTYRRISAGEIEIPVGKFKAKPMKKLMNLKPNDRQLFNQIIVGNLYSPGTLDEFADLIDKMMQINPDDRPNMHQVLAHPFFAGFFKPHPLDYGLWRPQLEVEEDCIQIFPKDHELWRCGANCFIHMAPDSSRYDEEVSYSIRFHGLDIYNRFLLKMEPSNDRTIYTKIAWSAGYIASKFFLDEASSHMYDIFPESRVEMPIHEVIKLEKFIIQVLKSEVYRPTCFTFLEKRAFYEALFILMLRDDLMYGRPMRRIMKIFNDDVDRILTQDAAESKPVEIINGQVSPRQEGEKQRSMRLKDRTIQLAQQTQFEAQNGFNNKQGQVTQYSPFPPIVNQQQPRIF